MLTNATKKIHVTAQIAHSDSQLTGDAVIVHFLQRSKASEANGPVICSRKHS